MTKLKPLTLLVLLFIITIAFTITTVFVFAQTDIVSKFERIRETEDLTLKLSFHSWGEDRTTELNLDQYFPVKRDPNSRYIFLAPPEISVRVDQEKGLAYLKAYQKWTGTKDVIFTLTNIYRLEEATSDLQKYSQLLTQQRAPLKIKREFEDLPPYHLFEKILDDLESKKTPTPEIRVTKRDTNIKIDVAQELKLDLDLETLTEDKLPTLKPKIAITIQPDQIPEEEIAEGLSFYLFIPLILILLTFLVIAGIYIKNHRKELLEKFRKKPAKEESKINKLITCLKDLSEVENKINKETLEKSTSNLFAIIKRFFNLITPAEYQFSYSEIKKEQLDKELDENLKEKLCEFSKNISDIRFSGQAIQKSELKKILSNARKLIQKSTTEEKSIKIEKEKEKLRKTFPIRTLRYILESFTTPRETKKRISRIKEHFDIKKYFKNLLHKLGLLQTLAEKELARKRKYQFKLKILRNKQRSLEERKHQKDLARKRKQQEKQRKKLLKLKEKQAKERLKLLEEQHKLREIQKRKEEKIRRRKARARAIRKYFHDKFGLFKTLKDIEKELEEKRKAKLEKDRFKRAQRHKLKQSFLNFLHFLRLYKTPEEKAQREEILKKEERLKLERIKRKRAARKQALFNFLHTLKLYRTPEEVEREKEKRLRKLREKARKKAEKYYQEQLERGHKLRKRQQEKLRKLAEKHRKQQLQTLEKARKVRQKELKKAQRRALYQVKKKQILKFLHNNLGLFKTPEEKARENERKFHKKLLKQKQNLKEKLEKQKAKEFERKEKERQKEQEAKLKLIEKQRKEELKKQKQARKRKLRAEKRRHRQAKRREFKVSLKKTLHKSLHRLGFFKTSFEIEKENRKKTEISKLKAIKKEKEQKEKQEKRLERKRKFKKFLHDHFGLYKTPLEKEEEKKERREKHRLDTLKKKKEAKERKIKILKFKRKSLRFLHDHFGLYKTKEELEKQKQKIKRRLQKKEAKHKLQELKRRQRKLKFHKLLHDQLGLFKTREELEAARKTRKQHRLELEQKLESTVLKALASRLQRKKLTPEQEIKILMQLEEAALRKKDTQKAEDLRNKINKLYKKIKREKTSKFPLLFNKISNKLEESRDYLFSQTPKLKLLSLSPFLKKLTRTLTPQPHLENAKLDQITYLVDKAEIELKRKRSDEAKEFYQRALHLYKTLNKSSKNSALPALLKIKNEITTLALEASMERAFNAMYLGQVKKAQDLYQNIDLNFQNLPLKEKERLHDKKTELYQKLTQPSDKKFPLTFTQIKSNFLRNLRIIKSKLSKKPKKFYPLDEKKFQPLSPSTSTSKLPLKKKSPLKELHFQKTESLSNYLLARKPKFTSIKTELINFKKTQNLTHQLLTHIKKAHLHLKKKNHEKAHKNYHLAANLFKDLSLKPEVRDNIYIHLQTLKHKILQTSLHNFIHRTKEAISKEKIEEARKHHQILNDIYSHIHKTTPSPTPKKISSLTLEEEIGQAFKFLEKGDIKEASQLYQKINSSYNNLNPEEKKIIYTKLINLYSELLRKSRR